MIDADAWEQPRLMAFLQAQGRIEPEEMARTFNCGIGMVAIVSEAAADEIVTSLRAAGETVGIIGAIIAGERGCVVRGPAGCWSARADWRARIRWLNAAACRSACCSPAAERT